jgi:tRNA(adenine34) deaminase
MESYELFSDAYFMNKALQLAEQAFEEEEIPIGAIVVHNQRIIGRVTLKPSDLPMLPPMRKC